MAPILQLTRCLAPLTFKLELNRYPSLRKDDFKLRGWKMLLYSGSCDQLSQTVNLNGHPHSFIFSCATGLSLSVPGSSVAQGWVREGGCEVSMPKGLVGLNGLLEFRCKLIGLDEMTHSDVYSFPVVPCTDTHTINQPAPLDTQ